MTDEELEIIGALHQCRGLGPGAWSFVRRLHYVASHEPDRALTTKERGFLFGLRWKYRRQIALNVSGLAEGMAQDAAHRRRANVVQTVDRSSDRRRRTAQDRPQGDLFGWGG